MPARYPSAVRRQVVELARAGTRVAQLAETFGMTETTIYNWINPGEDRSWRDCRADDGPGVGIRRGEAPYPGARDRARGLAEGQ